MDERKRSWRKARLEKDDSTELTQQLRESQGIYDYVPPSERIRTVLERCLLIFIFLFFSTLHSSSFIIRSSTARSRTAGFIHPGSK